MLIKALRLPVIFLLFSIATYAQNLSKSPYSALGIGDLQFGGNALQSAFGQSTQGLRRVSDINNQNPASYGALKYTVIEAGLNFSSGSVFTATDKNDVYNASFGYLNIGMPLW